MLFCHQYFFDIRESNISNRILYFERIHSYKRVFNSLIFSTITACLWSDLRLYSLQHSEWMLPLLKLSRMRCPIIVITVCICPRYQLFGIDYSMYYFLILCQFFLSVSIFFSKHFMSVNQNILQIHFKEYFVKHTHTDEVFVLRMIRVVSLLFTQQVVNIFSLIGNGLFLSHSIWVSQTVGTIIIKIEAVKSLSSASQQIVVFSGFNDHIEVLNSVLSRITSVTKTNINIAISDNMKHSNASQ